MLDTRNAHISQEEESTQQLFYNKRNQPHHSELSIITLSICVCVLGWLSESWTLCCQFNSNILKHEWMNNLDIDTPQIEHWFYIIVIRTQ